MIKIIVPLKGNAAQILVWTSNSVGRIFFKTIVHASQFIKHGHFSAYLGGSEL